MERETNDAELELNFLRNKLLEDEDKATQLIEFLNVHTIFDIYPKINELKNSIEILTDMKVNYQEEI